MFFLNRNTSVYQGSKAYGDLYLSCHEVFTLQNLKLDFLFILFSILFRLHCLLVPDIILFCRFLLNFVQLGGICYLRNVPTC
jgi:hypothetical protein